MSQSTRDSDSRVAASGAAPLTKTPARPLPFAVTVGLFVVSGATGLVDQLCFSKYLGYIVGSTAYAVSAVLAAFMTGLALGAHWGGRFSARIRRPLVAYAALELVVAVAVALTPVGFRALTPLYASLSQAAPESLALLSVLRWLVALLLVIVPTTAMGATLPFLSRGIEASSLDGSADADRRRERRLTWLYAANTFGGAGGALLAAYAVLPSLGIQATLLASAAGSALVGAVAYWLGRDRAVTDEAARGEDSARALLPPVSMIAPARRERGLLFGFAFASGFLVFAGEVVFTHLLALIIGNSAYAFGLILTAFLLSLFAGATLSGSLRARFGQNALPLGLGATALALLGLIGLWDDLPAVFASLGERVTSFEGREAVRGALAVGVLFLPTLGMGLTFPLLLQRVARYEGVGRWVGRLTAVNTLGAVTGALVTGYVVLPALGSQNALVAIGVGFVIAAAAALPWSTGASRWATLGAAGVALVVGLTTSRWDLERLTSGANVYFEGHKTTQKLVSIREDMQGGVTTVAESDGVHTLYTNGKFQGNTGWEMNAQRFFAHYPSIFVQRFDEALVIGLGTGTTLGTFTAYPWKRLDVVEISAAIVEAARRYFQVPNRKALDDPRVRLNLADGRNFLLVNERRYDLVSMELSSIWFAGASSLYSDEFYRLVRARLAPGGVFQQWVQLHHVTPRDFATIVHTLRKNFAHVALFYGGGQGILVASMGPLRASEARIRALEARPDVRETEPFGRSLTALLDDVLVLDDGLDAFLASVAQKSGTPLDALVSTDDNLYLEYATPRGNVLPWSAREALVADLQRYHDPAAVAALLVP